VKIVCTDTVEIAAKKLLLDMTLKEKLTEIEQSFIQWVGSYYRGEIVSNPIRITGEAICKSIILIIKGDADGTRVIEGNDPIIPQNRNLGLKLGQRLEFSELIIAVQELNGFRRFRGIQQHLELIRVLTNPGSHSANRSSDVLQDQDMKTLYNSISILLRWLFVDKLGRSLPNSIQDALQNSEDLITKDEDDIVWNEFLSLSRDFQVRRQYVLISPKILAEDAYISQAIARLPWRLVIDFNPDTDTEENGILYSFIKSKGSAYKKYFTIEDRLEFDPKFEQYWFLANGEKEGLAYPAYNEWRKKYKRYLSQTLYAAFEKGSRPQPRTVVLINIPTDFAGAIIDEFNAADEENLEFVLCNDGGESYDSFLSNYDNVKQIAISPAQMAKGINNTINFAPSPIDQKHILIPYKNERQEKSFVTIKQEDYDYLKTIGIEVVYRGIEKEEKIETSPDDFYKGGTITWTDLAEGKDIIRHSYDGLSKRLRIELERGKTKEIELIHEAGAGGTTVARRLAFDFCDSFPTVVLKQYEPKKTIAGLRIIYDQYINSSLPLLIILELYELKSSSQLYRDLGNVSKNAVILIVKRGGISNASNGKFSLKGQLVLPEISLFESKFSLLMPEKKGDIQAIKTIYQNTPQYISPFLYGLTTYERDFSGIESYVNKCINDLNAEQRKLIGFVCLVYHFTQRSVPGEFFTALFNTTREKCDLIKLLGEGSTVFEILHEDFDGQYGENTWRPRYAMLGEETMKIILAGTNGNRNNWRASLGQWLIEFIKYVKLAMPTLHDDTKLIFDSLFVTRGDYDGNEGRDQFTDTIKALVSPTDGVAVFEALTDAYPDEAHFHGHFARYLYKPDLGIQNYDRAIQEANKSLEIQPHDPSLVHTLGMCYKAKAEKLIDNYLNSPSGPDAIEEEVKEIVELASDEFDRSIALDDHNVYGHVTQSRLLLKALDFGFRLSSGTSKERFISNPSNDWYAKQLDKIGSLIEEANYILDQSKGLDNKARILQSENFVLECEGKYLIEMGQSLVAKNRYEDLIKSTPAGYQYMVPRYRSLFIRCLLASKSETLRGYTYAWDRLSESELLQCVAYLNENIFADPTNSHYIKMWLQAVRYLKYPPSIEECISKVAMWCQIPNQNSNSLLEGLYYLYVLSAVKAISSGAGFDPSSVHTVREIRDRMKGAAKNEAFSFEWYGNGVGIQQLINYRALGEINGGFFFERNRNVLLEVTGRIKEASNPQSGRIILECGLEAFFVPGKKGFTERNVNDRVKFYIGFRYDQISAWEVVPVDYVRSGIPFDEENDDEEYNPEEALEKKDTNPLDLLKTPTTENRPRPLPGLTIVGKIKLPHASSKESQKAPASNNAAILDKVYEGKIDRLMQPNGLIKTPELDQIVKFHISNLRNVPFHKLRVDQKVSFKLFIDNGLAKMDKKGENYIAKEVRII